MTGFFVFILIMCLLIPSIMIIAGGYFRKKAPKSINQVWGYRSERSMKNKDTWEFAHHYFGKLLFIIGLIMFPLSALPLLLSFGKDDDTIGIIGLVIILIQLIPLIAAIFPTEAALKRNFDENGIRKNYSYLTNKHNFQ